MSVEPAQPDAVTSQPVSCNKPSGSLRPMGRYPRLASRSGFARPTLRRTKYPVAVKTAIRILNQVGVQPEQTLLVSGAAGGVGSAVPQIARQRGIKVIATASERNQEYLSSLGATATTYGDGLVERVRALSPKGLDAALDIAGSGVLPGGE
jgi:hypothetical protein